LLVSLSLVALVPEREPVPALEPETVSVPVLVTGLEPVLAVVLAWDTLPQEARPLVIMPSKLTTPP